MTRFCLPLQLRLQLFLVQNVRDIGFQRSFSLIRRNDFLFLVFNKGSGWILLEELSKSFFFCLTASEGLLLRIRLPYGKISSSHTEISGFSFNFAQVSNCFPLNLIQVMS